MKRSFKHDLLYKTVFNEYVQQLLVDNHSLEFFVEGTRARGGKMLAPKFGILNILTNIYFSKKVSDLHFVPISISYSQVIEGETFPFELLGETRVEESLTRIIRATKYLKMNFGSVYIEIQDPISFKEFSHKLSLKQNLSPETSKEDQRVIAFHLGNTLIHKLTDKLIVMPSSI